MDCEYQHGHGLEGIGRLLYNHVNVDDSVRERNTGVRKVRDLFSKGRKRPQPPKRNEEQTRPYAGGSHTALQRTAPDEDFLVWPSRISSQVPGGIENTIAWSMPDTLHQPRGRPNTKRALIG